MHLFLSAGEPSGDLHGSNLVHALKRHCPEAQIVGFGGDRMSNAGMKLLFPLPQLAVMWFKNVIANIRKFIQLGHQAEQYFWKERPQAVVLIDFPGFHFALAKRAHAAGIPVYFFVPPQLWGWAGWRVRKVRRWFKGVLTTLPFEDAWYRQRGVRTFYVGHPYFDELSQQVLDEEFMAKEQAKGGRVVGILPGSRSQEVSANFPMMVRAMEKIAASCPEVRFLVASFKESQRQQAEALLGNRPLPIEFHVGRTPEIIQLAEVCLAVSGSVSLELMYRLKPTVIVYRVGRIFRNLAGLFIRTKYITLVNLLAEEELFPEMYGHQDHSQGIAEQIVSWLNSREQQEHLREKLRRLRDRVAQPGACDRAAEFLLGEFGRATLDRRAA